MSPKDKMYKFYYRGQQLIGHGGPIWNGADEYTNILCIRLQDKIADLPLSIVLKIDDPNGEQVFDHEKKVYNTLRRLQGQQIPVCYGIAVIEQRRALVLSHIHGDTLLGNPVLRIPDEGLETQLKQLYRSISDEGVICTDASVNNVLYSDGKFVALDFEHAEVQQPPQQNDNHINLTVESLMRMIQMQRQFLEIKPQKAKWI